MIKVIITILLLSVAILIHGCGKKPKEPPTTTQPQQTNVVSGKTNKLATFVQPKPRTNISIQVTPPKRTERPEVQTTVPQSGSTNVKLTVTVPPQTIVQPPVDYGSEQVESLKVRASNGDTTAQLELASRYLYGRGVNKDENEAIQWLAMAAQAGNPTAQNRLGLLYATGQAVQKDPTQAVYWYTLAAEQNHPTAQNNLGIMYATGNGVQKDEVEAYKWLTIAGSRITNAIVYRDSIAKNMTPEQIETAKQRAQEFLSRFAPQNSTSK